jgi:predicted nucleic acid-binding protein
MEDGRRSFVASSALKLELLPLPQYHGNHNEVAFYETFFHHVSEWQEVNETLLRAALSIAGRHGLHAMDGLHLAAATAMEVDEFITDEKPTKPIFRVKTPKVVALSTL